MDNDYIPEICFICQNKYQETDDKTCQCGARYIWRPDGEKRVLHSVRVNMFNGVLAWIIKYHCCSYLSEKTGRPQDLPWLPYHITPEQLKTYLIFS